MRLIDTVLRQGHLSEQALVEALLAGARPAHLDRCELCSHRALDLARWLDQIQTIATEAADAAFPPERLAIQQKQILRRLEQLDRPSRVVAFPNQVRLDSADRLPRRVAPGWVGVAAAAGLVLGVVGSQVIVQLGGGNEAATARRTPAAQTAGPDGATPSSLLDFDLENTSLTGTAAGTLDEMTPTIVSARAGG